MPRLYPLHLAANPESWRLFSVRKTDEGFQEYRNHILERDQFTCQFCGFQATQYQEIINLDNNYRNNKMTNMVTACCFCSQCFFLEAVGKDDYGGGILVYLPDISQSDLDGFCHVLFCAMYNATSYRNDAQNIYRSFKLRAQIVDKQLGEGMSDPVALGRMLIEATEEQRAEITKKVLTPLRLLPSYTRFNKQIEDWAKAALNDLVS